MSSQNRPELHIIILQLLIISVVASEHKFDCGRPNEHYECGSACQTTCDNYNRTCAEVSVACKKGCYCNKGYARDCTETCVRVETCFERQHGICGAHEEYRLDSYVYNECVTPLEYSLSKMYGCYCVKGYKRNVLGKCIQVKICPAVDGIKCTGDYEHYACGSATQTTCDNYNQTRSKRNAVCSKGCYCNDGYARNPKGVCIPVQNCQLATTDKCPQYEEYKYASPAKYSCVKDNCKKNLAKSFGCYCIARYKRDCGGRCVPKHKCPVSCKICGKRQEYRYDFDTSPGSKRCKKYKVLMCHCIKGYRYDNTRKCVPDTRENCGDNEEYSFDNYNNHACTANFSNPSNSLNFYGCHCKDGYRRNPSRDCVPENGCPEENLANCIRPNEHYECGSPCQKTCGTYKKPCDIQSNACIKGCYCNKGYARDCTGTCTAIENCLLRENGICGKKEEYRLDSFINNECAPNSNPLMIPPPMHGCYCIKGFKRNSRGDCIPERNCRI